MTETILSESERSMLVMLVASQLNQVKNFREMRLQTEELSRILDKIQPAENKIVVRAP